MEKISHGQLHGMCLISSLCTSSCRNEHVGIRSAGQYKRILEYNKNIGAKLRSSVFIKIHFGDHSNITCGQTRAKQSEDEFLDISYSMATIKILRDLSMR
jgi:hypothetical protein